MILSYTKYPTWVCMLADNIQCISVYIVSYVYSHNDYESTGIRPSEHMVLLQQMKYYDLLSVLLKMLCCLNGF